MSIMYCETCDKMVDTDFMDHCQFFPDFICENCVDEIVERAADYDGEPPVTWLENTKGVKPR
jgi:hypothetical protein